MPFRPPLTHVKSAIFSITSNLPKFRQIHLKHQHASPGSPPAAGPLCPASRCMEPAQASWARPRKARSSNRSTNSVVARPLQQHREHDVKLVNSIEAVAGLACSRPPCNQSTVPEPKSSMPAVGLELELLMRHLDDGVSHTVGREPLQHVLLRSPVVGPSGWGQSTRLEHRESSR